MSTGEQNLDSPATEAEVQTEAPAKTKLEYELFISDVGPCRKHLKVTIPKKEIDRQFAESLGEMTKEAHVPGFRPGHAPKNLVQRKFRKEVAGQVKSVLLMTALEQVEEDQKLNLISQPTLDVEAITLPEDGSPLVFELEVEIRPEFEVPEYNGLTVKRFVRTVTDKDIDAGYKTFLERNAEIVPKFEGGAELGDVVTVDMVFKDGDQVLNSVKELRFRLQPELRLQDGTIPNAGSALQGAKPGDSRSGEVQIGSSSANAAIRGKTIQVEFTLVDLKTVRLPEVDAEFLGELGFESVDDVRDAIRGMLERRYEFQQRDFIRRDILDQLLSKTAIELPGDLVRRQESDVYRRQIYDLRQSGLSDGEIRAREAQIRANAHESTLRTLREFFLLAKIAERENLKVDDSDIEAEIEAIAYRTGENSRRVRARVQKENLADSMATQILERKALDHILKSVTYVDVAPEEEKEVETVDHNVAPVTESADAPASEEAAS